MKMSMFGMLARSARRYGVKVALETAAANYSYRWLHASAHTLALELQRQGLRKKSVVAVCAGNSVETVVALFAVRLAGAIPLPLYHRVGVLKLAGLLDYCDASAILVGEQGGHVGELVSNRQWGAPRIVFSDAMVVISLLLRSGTRSGRRTPGKRMDHRAALLLPTSGTTGRPKVVMLSERNVASNVRSICEYLTLSQRDAVLIVKNMCHCSTLIGELLTSISVGATVYILQAYPTPSTIIRRIKEKSITVLFAIPTLLRNLVDSPALSCEATSSLRAINFYGEPVDVLTIERMAVAFPSCDLVFSYGLTEASPRVTHIHRADLIQNQTSSGWAISGTSVHIMGHNDIELPTGMRGEIAVRGPNVMLGYLASKELTRQRIRRGLLFTGDVGFVDNKGLLHVVGRLDNMAVIAGRNIFPEEIELVCLQMPGILKVLVSFAEAGPWGPRLVAQVVISPGLRIKGEDIVEFCRQRLEDYKVPKDVIFVESLATTPSGKVIRTSTEGGRLV